MDIREEKVLALIAAVQSGDRSAFSALLSMYRPLLGARISRFSPSDTERDELYQDASLALYRAALCYRADTGVSFGAFARVCVDNALISAYRKASAERGVCSLDALRESGDEPLALGVQQGVAGRVTKVAYLADEAVLTQHIAADKAPCIAVIYQSVFYQKSHIGLPLPPRQDIII